MFYRFLTDFPYRGVPCGSFEGRVVLSVVLLLVEGKDLFLEELRDVFWVESGKQLRIGYVSKEVCDDVVDAYRRGYLVGWRGGCNRDEEPRILGS